MSKLEEKIAQFGAIDLLTLTQIINTLIEQHEEAKNTAWRVRMPGTAYNVGDKVIVPGAANFDKVLQCTTAGVTAAGAFPQSYDAVTVGNTINDGTAQWQVVRLAEIPDIPGAPVTSVNSKTGDVKLGAADVGASPVGHTHSYLPLSGGIMTGNEISRQGTANSLRLFGGDDPAKCAYILLFGADSPSDPGLIRLISRNSGTGYSELRLTPSGAMKWKEKNVVRSVNGIDANAEGNAALSIADIPSLQMTLDDKAPVAHSHNVPGYPDYENGVATDGEVLTYTAPEDGWVYGERKDYHMFYYFEVNGAKVAYGGGEETQSATCFVPVKKGDVVRCMLDTGTGPYTAKYIYYPNR